MVDFGMDPQSALDAPRFSLAGVDSVEGPSCVARSRYAVLTQGKLCLLSQVVCLPLGCLKAHAALVLPLLMVSGGILLLPGLSTCA